MIAINCEKLQEMKSLSTPVVFQLNWVRWKKVMFRSNSTRQGCFLVFVYDTKQASQEKRTRMCDPDYHFEYNVQNFPLTISSALLVCRSSWGPIDEVLFDFLISHIGAPYKYR